MGLHDFFFESENQSEKESYTFYFSKENMLKKMIFWFSLRKNRIKSISHFKKSLIDFVVFIYKYINIRDIINKM